VRLLLCAGSEKRAGWVTHDGRPESGADIVGTIPPLPEAIRAVEWLEIEWIHGVGTFYPWIAREILAELYGVLVPGGRLVLEQPDILKAAQMVLNDNQLTWCLFGDPSHQDPAMMNAWAYTPSNLSDILLELGFRCVEILPALHHNGSRDFRIEAVK
jgi:hypothetical protein